MTTEKRRREFGFDKNEKRKQIEARSVEGGVRCDNCGKVYVRNLMQAHHIFPIEFIKFFTGGTLLLGPLVRHWCNMAILCPDCHDVEERKIAEIKKKRDAEKIVQMARDLQKRKK